MMRKAATLLIGLVFLVSATQANAPAARISVVDECYMPASDYNTNGNVIIGQGKAVVSSDDNGNSKITCKGIQPKNIPYPDKAVHFDYASTGEVCYIGASVTQDWDAVVTPGGQATLTCKINPSSTP